jgi:L-iditol 2-dehydrogenase
MKALVLAEKGRFELVRRDSCVLPEGEVMLKVAYCAICRTDAKMWSSGHRDLVLPRVLGHELCGFIDGDPRQPVAVWPGRACGICSYCSTGRENLCPAMQITGFHRDGGFAEYLHVPQSSLIPLPPALAPEYAVFAEPLACALHGLRQLKLKPDERVLIYGAGTLGLLLALGAIDLGAEVAIIEPDACKLERSRRFRKRFCINSGDNYPGGSFDAVLNAASASVILSSGLHTLKAGGRFCLFSGLQGSVETPLALFHELHYRELELTGSYGCNFRDMIDAVHLLERYSHELDFLVERRIRLDEVSSIMGEVLDAKGFRYVIGF